MSDDTYDYVIVGAGSAGAVLAAKQRFKPLLALTTFKRTEKADQQLVKMITMLHGRGTTIPKK